MINIYDKRNCTGCLACSNVCPQKAISFSENFQGYSYPRVNISRCINCNLCDKVCPINNLKNNSNFNVPVAKLAWSNNDSIRINSTSGGVFSLIAQAVLKKNGYVVGAEFTDDFTLHHVIISKLDEIYRIRKAKYIQSNMGNIFSKIKNLLDNDKLVLFCGTPCQNAGLKGYLRKEYNNLLSVELICHGVVSQKIFKDYLHSIENHRNSRVINVEFRNKDKGWNKSSTKITLDDGNFYYKDRSEDEYMIGYLKHNLFMRPSCYKCKFKGFPRISDITLGDFWGIEELLPKHDDKGISAVLINSEKGNKIFNEIIDYLVCDDVSLDIITKNNPSLIKSVVPGKYSNYFFKHFEKTDFIDLIHKIDRKALLDNGSLTVKDRLYLLKKNILNKVRND